MKRFHAHIYFAPDKLALARALAARARSAALFETVKVHETPVGPHPTGMIEAHFGEPSYHRAVAWLDSQRGGLSTLIHEDSGDDLKDHTEGSRWLGETVPLDFSFFELIRLRPELRIHGTAVTAAGRAE